MKTHLIALIVVMMVVSVYAGGMVAVHRAAAQTAQTLPWSDAVTVDQSSQDWNGLAGQYNSLALDANGNPHISYFDYQGPPPYDYALKYAFRDADGWHTEVVDTEGEVGRYSSLALDTNGNPHISYQDETNDNLKYAYKDASGWHTDAVDVVGPVGLRSSIDLDASGNPHISYHDWTHGALKYAYKDAAGWHTEFVTGGGGGQFNSLALDASGNPYISYESDAVLKYAYKDVSGWHIEMIDTEGYAGWYNSLALDASGKPHVSYFRLSSVLPVPPFDPDMGVKYAYKDDAGWHTEVVETALWAGHFSSLALDKEGKPHISYADLASQSLMYANKDATGWHIQIVPTGVINQGLWEGTSLAIDASGKPHISWCDSSYLRALKYIEAKTTKATVVDTVQNLQTTINSLDPSVFTTSNTQTPLTNKLNAVINDVNAGDYTAALDKLQNDLMKKTDGCLSPAHQPDKNDWIKDCATQHVVYGDLTFLVNEVKALQASS